MDLLIYINLSFNGVVTYQACFARIINVITDATKFVIKSCVSRLDFMVP